MRRITPATVTFGVLITLIGLVVAYIVRTSLTPRATAELTRRVPVAVSEISKDTVLTPEHIVFATVAIEKTRGAFLMREALFGRRVKAERIAANQPFLTTQLYPPGEGPQLSAKLEKGFRAVTIETSSSSATLQGMVRPGDHVDVLMTVTGNRDIESPTTLTLLENVQLLAVSRNQSERVDTRESRDSSVVTLAVTPEQANILVLAKDRGELHLALRGAEETGRVGDNRITLNELLGIEAPPSAAEEPPPPPIYIAEAYRGGNKEVVEFDLEQARALKMQRPGQAAVPNYMGVPRTSAPQPAPGSRTRSPASRSTPAPGPRSSRART